MIRIDYPKHPFRIKEEGNKEYIFDEVRKVWTWLTPEEWVRQNFLQWLMQTKNYPASLMAVEKEIKLGELRKRCDIVVYKNKKPWMIVECKEMEVTVNEKTMVQVLNYNQSLDVEYLIVTNGKATFGIRSSTKNFLTELPDY